MSLLPPFTKLPLELEGREKKYIITREHNRNPKCGYMSVIYKALDSETRKLFALKTLWTMT